MGKQNLRREKRSREIENILFLVSAYESIQATNWIPPHVCGAVKKEIRSTTSLCSFDFPYMLSVEPILPLPLILLPTPHHFYYHHKPILLLMALLLVKQKFCRIYLPSSATFSLTPCFY